MDCFQGKVGPAISISSPFFRFRFQVCIDLLLLQGTWGKVLSIMVRQMACKDSPSGEGEARAASGRLAF